MSTTELIGIFEKLPADKQKEVEDFTAFLLSKTSLEKQKMYPHIKPGFGGGKGILGSIGDDFDGPLNMEAKKKLKRKFGELKGFVTYMSDDFNKPLDDFKDYM